MKSLYKYTLQLILVLALALSVMSCSKVNTNFKVEGKLENLALSHIYAIREFSVDSLTIDTIPIKKDGEFSYSGMVDYPTFVTLSSGEEGNFLTLFLDKDYNVKIKGDVLSPDLVDIKGGSVNDDLQSFRTKNAAILHSKYRVLGKNENLDPAELKNINLQLARNVREYVEENPAKIASVILMNKYSINNLPLDQLGDDIKLLKGAALNFYLTYSLKQYYDRVKSSAVGAIAPNITLKNTKGKTVNLFDFKGKPVLLIFDLKESPLNTSYFTSLKDAQKKLKDKIEFITIVIDEDDRFPDKKTLEIANTLDWTVLLDGNKWASKEVKKYYIKNTPCMLLISADGIIEQRDVTLDSLLIQYDKEKINMKEIL